MSRFHALALAVLSVGVVSGGAPVETGADEPLAKAAEQRVEARMRQLNPALSPSDAARIRTAVDRNARKYGLAPDLVLAVLEVESGARIGARSPKGAMGLMQVMPHMARRLDLAGNHTTVETNVEAGCVILAHNIRRLGEDDGISAYFWGSDIRSVSYLNRVREARPRYRELLAP